VKALKWKIMIDDNFLFDGTRFKIHIPKSF
jgi:hypothetical protein